MCDLADFAANPWHTDTHIRGNLSLLLAVQALERLKSHRVLAKIKQTLRDMGIPAADVAVLPKIQASLHRYLLRPPLSG